MQRAMREAGFDALFEGVDDIDFTGEPEHGNGSLLRLRDVEEVVQQRLPRVRCKQIEFI